MAYSNALYAIGTWGTLSNVFFFGAAVFSDLLLIRLTLTLAYLMLFINAFMGLPNVPKWTSDFEFLPWGFIFWSSICGMLHAIALFRHLWDERPIKFQGDEEELFRCIYRRSGMGRVEFLELLKRGTWNRYKAGDTIYLKGCSEMCVHVIMEGVVSLCVDSDKTAWWHLYSGEMFDYILLNLFGVYIGFDHTGGAIFQVDAKTDCLLFTWHASQVSEMAFAVSPAVSGYWRNLVLYMVGSDFTRRGKHNTKSTLTAHDSQGVDEDPSFFTGARTRDMTRPLEPSELPSYGPRAWLAWLWQSVSLFPPVGLRHTSLPASGMRAAARTQAFMDQDHLVVKFRKTWNPNRSALELTPNPTITARGLSQTLDQEPTLDGVVVAPMLVRYSSGGHEMVFPPSPTASTRSSRARHGDGDRSWHAGMGHKEVGAQAATSPGGSLRNSTAAIEVLTKH